MIRGGRHAAKATAKAKANCNGNSNGNDNGLSDCNGRRMVAITAMVAAVVAAVGAVPAAAQRLPDQTPPASSAPAATTPQTLRDQEIASCRPGESTTWGDGRDRRAVSRPLRFVYRHDAAPPWFDAAQVLALAQRSVQAWARCGVPASVQALPPRQLPTDGDIQIVWTDTGSRGQFGLANVPARTLSLGPGLFRLLRERNPRYPAEQTLQMVLSHEMGHFYGLMAHSRRCVDVMSYYDDGKGQRCTLRDASAWGSVVEYRSMLPTACDLERCRALNGEGSGPGSGNGTR